MGRGISSQNCPLPWEIWTSVYYMLPWAHQSPQPKRHPDQFNGFCTAHAWCHTGHASQTLVVYLRAEWLLEGRWPPRLHSSKEYGTLCLYHPTISSKALKVDQCNDPNQVKPSSTGLTPFLIAQPITPVQNSYHPTFDTLQTLLFLNVILIRIFLTSILIRRINVLTLSYFKLRNMPSVLWHCWLGGRKGIWAVKNGGWWRWALVSLDGVVPSRMVDVSASVNLPLHHKVQKFSPGTGSPKWSPKKGHKMVVVVW